MTEQGSWTEVLNTQSEHLGRPAWRTLVRAAQHARWRAGHAVMIEELYEALPPLRGDAEAVLDLAAAEVQLRRDRGESPHVEEYVSRFPAHEAALRGFFALEARLGGAPAAPQASVASETVDDSRVLLAPRSEYLSGRLGRYNLLKKLGGGGMGAVYLAYDTGLNRQVALKVPQLPPGRDQEARERFVREAHASAALRHPNICTVYDVGEADGLPYLTMEFIDGVSLDRRLDEDRPFTPAEAAELTRTLALALAEAHRRGVIHRDLKPANVMLDRTGRPVVMDFGLAHRVMVGVSGSESSVAKVRGTPAYMPPEQLHGDPRLITPAADVYSLGVMLYEMLAGRVPYAGPTAAVFGQILSPDPPQRPSVFRPGLPLVLEEVCLSAIAKRPQDRIERMEHFAASLAEFLRGPHQKESVAEAEPAAAPDSTAIRFGRLWPFGRR
jgi:predicted Ser/Thr protein kinase